MRIVQVLLLVIPMIFGTTSLFAQVSINFGSINGQDVAGSQIVIDTIPTAIITIPHLYVTNNSKATQNWMITRINLKQPKGWFNYLCWGGLCYGISKLNTWSSSTTSINNGDTEELSLYVGAPDGGNSHYRYYISTDGINYLDSVDVFVNVTPINGLFENTEDEIYVFPNPAQAYITFTGIKISDYDISILDIFGREVLKKRSLNNDNIDVSTLSDGQYFFVVRNEKTNTILSNQIIIKK